MAEALRKIIRENPLLSLVAAAAAGAAAYNVYSQSQTEAEAKGSPKADAAPVEVMRFEGTSKVSVTVEPRAGKKLAGRVALVTGSSSGIGKGVAIGLAEEGASVVVNYPSGNEKQRMLAEEVVQACRACGGKSIAIGADVSSESQVKSMVEQVLKEMGQIDILVNNAGIASSETADKMSSQMWDQVIAVNLRSVFLCTRYVLPHMYERNYGKIINTASQLAYKGAPGFCHYTATKGAILSFTRSVALEIGDRNVNINCVGPGATMTPILENVPADILKAIESAIPKGKIAQVRDIVPTYVFLASEESSHFVGQCLSPNGGDMFL